MITLILTLILNFYVISISGGRSSLFMYFAYFLFLFIFIKINIFKKLLFFFIILISFSSILFLNENVLERVVKKTYFEFTGKSISEKKDPYKVV